MMFAFVLAVYIAIGYLEIYPLIRQKKKKELKVYAFLISAAFIISLFLSLGVEIPSPAKLIERIVMLVSGK
jgi:hypothetical protein